MIDGNRDDDAGLCHGFGAVSANILPDLRRSAFLPTPEGWQAVVIGGALAPRGMVSWKKYVTPAQAEAIRAYVGEQARTLKLGLEHKALAPAAAGTAPGAAHPGAAP